MPAITLDFSDVDDFDPIPKGTYEVRIAEVTIRDSKSSDAQYINWKLIVTDGEFEGSALFTTNGLTEKSLYFLRKQFRDLGVLGEDEDAIELEVDDETGMITYPDFGDMLALADVTVQVSQGTKRNAVTRLYIEQEEEPVSKKASKQAPKKGGLKLK